MAGHSKFKNIMYRKGAQDVRRARLFTKLGREIYVAAKTGGTDPDHNPRLRTAIQKARTESMPNDRIKGCIQRAMPGQDNTHYDEVRYEGYGPGGVALIVEALTDNRNRTAGEIRAAFTKHDGNLGETNSVSFMFDRVGGVSYPLSVGDEDHVFEAALEAGADHVERESDGYILTTLPERFSAMRAGLEEKLGAAPQAGLIWIARVMVPVTDQRLAETIRDLIEALEDNDDVQSVFHNTVIEDPA